MAEILLSPGVSLAENDTSQITTGPITAGLALIGPTVKGRPNIPTLVTSYSDFRGKFGDSFESASNNYEFLTSISAYNYFQQGGQSILVTRVTSGSYSSATASVPNSLPITPGTFATASFGIGTVPNNDFNNFEMKAVWEGKLYRFINTVTDANGNLPADDTEGTENIFFYDTASFTGGSPTSNIGQSLVAKINSVLPIVDASWDSFNALVQISGSASGSLYNGIYWTSGSTSFYVDPLYLDKFYIVDLNGESAVTSGGTDGNAGYGFILETISEGADQNNVGTIQTNNALLNGGVNNIRWEVIGSDVNNGTFSLVIRQGNDDQQNKTVLETWTNLSLDPNAPNYISAVIGDKKQTPAYDPTTGHWYINSVGDYNNNSRYVRVKEVLTPTYNYFFNNGQPNPAYATYLPLNGSGSLGGAFGGATGNDLQYATNLYNNISLNTQGLPTPVTSYAIAVDLMGNTDEYDYQLITTPGLLNNVATHTPVISNVIANTEAVGDAFYIMDLVVYGANLGTATSQAATRNTSYAASYWPWVQVLSPATGKLVWVPPSVIMPGVYAFNDRVAAEWFAPAGLNRGGLGGALQAERKLNTTERDTLYINKVNPIASFPGVGLVAYGQKTLQTKASALDRINVRRLLINLKRYVGTVANTLLFEQNTITTRNNFLAQVNPYLEQVQQKQGLYAYKVVMDDSNNTPETIDRNQLVGAIYIQPAKTVEFIYLTFNITPTGVSFE